MRTLNTLLLLLCTGIAVSSTANNASSSAILTPFQAHYDAEIKGFAVKAKRELTALDNHKYQLRFSADSWAASIEETSSFQINDQKIQAHSYLYQQTTFGKKKQREIMFDQEQRRVISTDNGQTVTIDTDTTHTKTFGAHQAVLDKLNYQLQLQLDIAALTTPTDAASLSSLSYAIVDKNQLRQYQFEVMGTETIDTKLGQLLATKVKVIRENADKMTYIWFANDWQFLLVQLEQYEEKKKNLGIYIREAIVDQKTITGL